MNTISDCGTMIIRRADREEVFKLQSATMTAFRGALETELYFHVEIIDPTEDPNRTSAEASVYLTDFDLPLLTGRRFEIPHSYDDQDRCLSEFTYGRERFFNNVVLRIIDRVGDKFRIQWTGSFNECDTESRVVIDALFEFLGFRSKLEDIESPTDFLKPFPAYEDVFGAPLPLHRKHLLPLLSVNAAVIHDDLNCWLHFVSPIEPLMEGNVGDWTGPHHDFYNRVGQVAFQLNQGKYSFTGAAEFFLYESLAQCTGPWYTEEEMREDYQRRLADYEVGRKYFAEHGRLKGQLVNRLGGPPKSTNWGNQLPRNKSGKPFRWIGEIEGFTYCHRLADFICLYYDPEEQVALLRYDWS